MDQLYVAGENTHYLLAAQTMIELDKEKEELAKARAVSNRVTNLGFGDARFTLCDTPNFISPRLTL